jgi:serine/threonine-protein kinase
MDRDDDLNPPTQETVRGAPPAPPEAQRADPALKFGKYARTRKLGAGGMGEVWKAWDGELGRWAALKFIKASKERAQDAEDVARFQREARLAAKLSHPNIAAIYEVMELGGIHCIAMQYVDGVTLKQWRAERATTVGRKTESRRGDWRRECVAMVRDAARAVQSAHEGGVVHRDLKPDNVMVTGLPAHQDALPGGAGASGAAAHGGRPDARAGHVFVMDFGLARSTEGASGLTMSGQVVGTPSYMPPEQARGHAVDARADVYSLGATLYELLTGAVPFNGANVYDTLLLVTESEAVTPRRLDPSIDRDLETIVLKCLEKDRARRYATMGALGDELTRWLEGEPISAHPPSALYKLRKRVARNPWAWSLAAVALVAAVAGAAAVGGVSLGAGRDRRAAELVQKAERLYESGDMAGARGLVESALALRPEHEEARYWRARLAIREYQAERGLPEARVTSGIVELMPQAPESEMLKRRREAVERDLRGLSGRPLADGILAMWRGETAKAVESFRKVERDAPGAWEAELYRGLAHYLAGEFEAAREPLAKHRLRDPAVAGAAFVRTLLALALEYATAGRDAMGLLQQASGACHDVPGEARQVLEAEVYVFYGRSEEARGDDPFASYARALKLTEGLAGVDALLARGDARLAQAHSLAERGRLAPKDPAELREAIECFRKAGESHPAARLRQAEALYARYRHRRDFGSTATEDLEAARDVFAAASEKLPNHPDAASACAAAKSELAAIRAADTSARVAALEEEVRELSALVAAHPSRAPLRSRRGQARSQLAEWRERLGEPWEKEIEEALLDFDAVLAVRRGASEALKERGRAWVLRGILEDAHGRDAAESLRRGVADLEDAIALNGSDAGLQRALSWARRMAALARSKRGEEARGDLDRAKAAAQRALALNGRDADNHHEFASLMRLEADLAETLGADATATWKSAHDAFDRALELNPVQAMILAEAAGAWRNDAMCRERRGLDPTAAYTSSLSLAERAVDVNAALSEAHLARAMSRAAFGTWKEQHGQAGGELFTGAMADFDRAAELAPLDWRIFHLRGLARQNIALLRRSPIGEFEEAVRDLDRAVERNRSSFEAARDRGIGRLNLAEAKSDPVALLTGALKDLERAVDLNPRDPESWKFRGSAHGAMALARESEGADPRAEYKAALDDLERSRRLNGRDPEVYRMRGQTLQNLGAWKFGGKGDPSREYEQAVADYGAALAIKADDAEAYSGRGTTRQNLGYWKEQLKGDPTAEYEAAAADHAKAFALNGRNAEYAKDAGEALRMLGLWESKQKKEPASRYGRALEMYTKAAEVAGDDPSILLERAKTALLLATVDGTRRAELKKVAAADLERVIVMDPGRKEEAEMFLRAARQ